MKKLFLLVIVFVLGFSSVMVSAQTDEPVYVHKQFTINTVPPDAEIFAINQEGGGGETRLGAGSVIISLDKDTPYLIEIRKDGYQRFQRTYMRGKGDREDNIQMVIDEAYTKSDESKYANTNFTVTVSSKINATEAWKIIAGIVQSYFEDIQVMDATTNYLKTNWVPSLPFNKGTSFPRLIRTQVVVSSGNTNPLKYNVKIKSEISKVDKDCTPGNKLPVLGKDECFEPFSRILKKYKDMINEIQNRLNKEGN
jgi:hypothetical protein